MVYIFWKSANGHERSYFLKTFNEIGKYNVIENTGHTIIRSINTISFFYADRKNQGDKLLVVKLFKCDFNFLYVFPYFPKFYTSISMVLYSYGHRKQMQKKKGRGEWIRLFKPYSLTLT